MVIFNNDTLKESVKEWCNDIDAARSKHGHIMDWDVSNVTDMSHLFRNSGYFNEDIGKWDVSNVTNMSQMFDSAISFNQNIGKWDVSMVENMSWMFSYTEFFNQDISKWDVSKVTDMRGMFENTQSFNQDIGKWDVSNVTNMSGMFQSAGSFNQDIGKWDVSKVTDMSNMFSYAEFFNQNIGKWDVSNVTPIEVVVDSGIIREKRKISYQIPEKTMYIIESIEINGCTLKEEEEFRIEGFIKCEKWDFGDESPIYIFDPHGYNEFDIRNTDDSIVDEYNGKGIIFNCKKLNYQEEQNIPVHDIEYSQEDKIVQLQFYDIIENEFIVVGGVVLDRIIWQKYSDVLFTNLPYDDLTEATDEDEDNFDNTRYFGRCECNVDTITFNGGISGFYFTGNYYADYMQVVPEE